MTKYFGAESMLYLTLIKTPFSKDVLVSLALQQPSQSRPLLLSSLEDHMPRDSVLVRFLEKTRHDLATSDPEEAQAAFARHDQDDEEARRHREALIRPR